MHEDIHLSTINKGEKAEKQPKYLKTRAIMHVAVLAQRLAHSEGSVRGET